MTRLQGDMSQSESIIWAHILEPISKGRKGVREKLILRLISCFQNGNLILKLIIAPRIRHRELLVHWCC